MEMVLWVRVREREKKEEMLRATGKRKKTSL
jgi:hypothetical protein